jgi:hypothetical protein
MEADFTFSTVHLHVPLYLRAAVFSTVLYAVWCSLTAYGHRLRLHGWFWRPAGPALLCLLPLFVNVPIVWFGYSRVAQGMSISGAGRAALSAGLAEALSPLFVASVVSSILAGVVLLIPTAHALRGRVDPEGMTTYYRSYHLATVALGCLLILAELIGVVWFADYLFHHRAFAPHHVHSASVGFLISAGVAIIATIVISWTLSKRVDQNPPWLSQLRLLVFVLVLASAAAFVIGRVIDVYRQIAMGKFPAA